MKILIRYIESVRPTLFESKENADLSIIYFKIIISLLVMVFLRCWDRFINSEKGPTFLHESAFISTEMHFSDQSMDPTGIEPAAIDLLIWDLLYIIRRAGLWHWSYPSIWSVYKGLCTCARNLSLSPAAHTRRKTKNRINRRYLCQLAFSFSDYYPLAIRPSSI